MAFIDILKAAGKEAIKPESHQKGDKFEDYILSLFSSSNLWDLIKRTQDYDHNNQMYEKSSLEPDFRFKYRSSGMIINIECKYRKSLFNGALEWCKDWQFKRYKKGDKYNNTYIIIGYGGEPKKPQKMYLLKLSEIKYSKLYLSHLKNFEIKIDRCFDMKNRKIVQLGSLESKKLLFNKKVDLIKGVLDRL